MGELVLSSTNTIPIHYMRLIALSFCLGGPCSLPIITLSVLAPGSFLASLFLCDCFRSQSGVLSEFQASQAYRLVEEVWQQEQKLANHIPTAYRKEGGRARGGRNERKGRETEQEVGSGYRSSKLTPS